MALDLSKIFSSYAPHTREKKKEEEEKTID